MSIAISYTDRGEIIYDGNGEIWLTKGSNRKVYKKCDVCGEMRWYVYKNLVRDRNRGAGKD